MSRVVQLFLLSACSCHEALTLDLPWDTGSMSVGYGVNSATGQVLSRQCITGLKTFQDTSVGYDIKVSFKGINSTAQMSKELDASVGASYGGFGKYLSAHASYVKSQTLSPYEAAYVLKVTVDLSSSIRLDPSAVFNSSLNSRPDLAELCGDAFIERAIMGGRLYATFRLDKSTFDAHNGTSVNVSDSGCSPEIESAMSSAMNHSSSSGAVNVDALIVGGRGTDWTRLRAPLTAQQLAYRASNFLVDVESSPYPFEAHIVSWGDYFKDYNPEKSLSIEVARQQMQILLEYYQAVENIQASIIYINTHSSLFQNYTSIKETCLNPLNTNCTACFNTILDAYNLINSNFTAQIQTVPIPDSSCLPVYAVNDVRSDGDVLAIAAQAVEINHRIGRT